LIDPDAGVTVKGITDSSFLISFWSREDDTSAWTLTHTGYDSTTKYYVDDGGSDTVDYVVKDVSAFTIKRKYVADIRIYDSHDDVEDVYTKINKHPKTPTFGFYQTGQAFDVGVAGNALDDTLMIVKRDSATVDAVNKQDESEPRAADLVCESLNCKTVSCGGVLLELPSFVAMTKVDLNNFEINYVDPNGILSGKYKISCDTAPYLGDTYAIDNCLADDTSFYLSSFASSRTHTITITMPLIFKLHEISFSKRIPDTNEFNIQAPTEFEVKNTDGDSESISLALDDEQDDWKDVGTKTLNTNMQFNDGILTIKATGRQLSITKIGLKFTTFGAVTCGSVNAGIVTCGSVNAGTGTVACGTITSSGDSISIYAGTGAVTCGSVNAATGAVTCGSVNAGTGAVTCGTITSSGAVTCGTITSSGAVTCGSVNAGTGTVTCGTLSSSPTDDNEKNLNFTRDSLTLYTKLKSQQVDLLIGHISNVNNQTILRGGGPITNTYSIYHEKMISQICSEFRVIGDNNGNGVDGEGVIMHRSFNGYGHIKITSGKGHHTQIRGATGSQITDRIDVISTDTGVSNGELGFNGTTSFLTLRNPLNNIDSENTYICSGTGKISSFASDIYLGGDTHTDSAGYITHGGNNGFIRLKRKGVKGGEGNDIVLSTSNDMGKSYISIGHQAGDITSGTGTGSTGPIRDVSINTYHTTFYAAFGGTSQIGSQLVVRGFTQFFAGTTGSDDRMKVNEVAIEGVTNVLMKLRPQTYDKLHSFDGDKSNSFRESGLIAQEIWYDCPELRHLVTVGRRDGESKEEAEGNVEADVEIPEDPRDDPDYSSWGPNPASVNYNGFIAYLIRGFQEQQQEIQTLKEEISALKSSP
jgi:hypothetical protein